MKKQVNKKNNYFVPIFSLLFSALFLLYGCGSGGGGGGGSSWGGSGSTPVSISLNAPAKANSSASLVSSGALSGGVSAQVDPGLVASIVIEISGSDMATITRIYNISPGQFVRDTIDVPSGDNRVFLARAYSGPDGTGLLLYESPHVTLNLDGTEISVPLAMLHSDISRAMDALNAGDIVSAHELFEIANLRYSEYNDDSKNAVDFFYALTRIWIFWFDMHSEDGLSDVGEIFDILGCDQTRDPLDFDMEFLSDDDPVDPQFLGMICPGSLPVDFPAGNIKDLLHDISIELDAAISSLNNIPGSFNITWTEPFDNTNVESDYGDVLFLRAVFNAAKAVYTVVDAYDPVNILGGTDLNTYTKQDFFGDNPDFPARASTGSSPSDSKRWQEAAINDFELAINEIEREMSDSNESPLVDWVTLSGEEIVDARADLNGFRGCFDGVNYGECIVDDNDTPLVDTDDTSIDLGPYFNDNIVLNQFWQTETGHSTSTTYFIGDDPAGFFPDPSFGGMLNLLKGNDPVDLNADEDDDGNADIFQKDIYYVYGGIPTSLMDNDEACRNPLNYGLALLGTGAAGVFDPVFTGALDYYYYIIKVEAKDLGFFGEIVSPEVNIDAVEFMDVYEYNISFLNEGAVTNFYSVNIFGSPNDFSTLLDRRSDCILVDNGYYEADTIKVYTMP